jgi:hypothetical protein
LDPVGLLEKHEAAAQSTLADELLLYIDGKHLQDDSSGAQLLKPEVPKGIRDTSLTLVQAPDEEIVVTVRRRQGHD